MFTIYQSIISVFFFTFLFQHSAIFRGLSQLQQSSVPLQFSFPDLVITTVAMPSHWTFYFQGSEVPIYCCGSWYGSMYMVHPALLKPQAVVLILCRMASQLSGKVVVLHLDNSTVKAYICKSMWFCTVSVFLYRLVCHILNLADKHGITLIPGYISTHLNVEAKYLVGKVSEWCILPNIAQLAFHLWDPLEVYLLLSSCINQWQLYYTLEKSSSSGRFGVNIFSQPWTYQVSYVFFFSCISSPGSVQVSGRMCHRLTQTLYSSGTFWMETPWLPTVLSMLEDIPHQYPILRDLIMFV